MSDIHSERVQRLDADLDLLGARIAGLTDLVDTLDEHTKGMATDVVTFGAQMSALAAALTEVAGAIKRTVDQVSPKTWIVAVPGGDEHEVGPVEFLVMVHGDAMSLAARRESVDPWGRPYSGELR